MALSAPLPRRRPEGFTPASLRRRLTRVGLGLAIVRAIAEAHVGRVAVGQRPETGTRIELELQGFTASGSREQNSELAVPIVR